MSDTVILDLPNAMIKSINEMCRKEQCTTQELIRTAISKLLFEHSKSSPKSKVLVSEISLKPSENGRDDPLYEIPLERIVAVRYTMDDGKVIHIMRGKKTV